MLWVGESAEQSVQNYSILDIQYIRYVWLMYVKRQMPPGSVKLKYKQNATAIFEFDLLNQW